ncbi:sigma-70 family RNA polymerase sigma factor [Bremerella sp. JC817]|uniref:sigma-70 family RNA polymerase sigma factor n=1 Tax=Bremerella sp. JC817 TaxID=3231756 RepID=UPI003459CD85
MTNDPQHESEFQPLQAGNDGLASLFAEHRERLRRMIDIRLDSRVAGRVDPSDILQETYLEAARQLPAFLEQRNLPPKLWLRLLARQQIIAAHRHHLGVQKRDAKLEVSLSNNSPSYANPESLSQFLAAGMMSPSRDVAKQEFRQRLRSTLENMDPLDREVIALRHFDELSNSEVAVELNISKTAASNRYIRALQRLNKLLSSASWLPDA